MLTIFQKILKVTAKSEDGVAMAVEHKSKNIFGIQFHPESIFTEYGKNMIRNFLNIKVSKTLQNNENSKNTNEKGNFIDMNKYLKKLQENIALTDTDFREICKIIDSKNYDIVQLGALLVLISEKSLYPESLTAFVKNILEYSTTFEDDSDIIDVCGTGGDGVQDNKYFYGSCIYSRSNGSKCGKTRKPCNLK